MGAIEQHSYACTTCNTAFITFACTLKPVGVREARMVKAQTRYMSFTVMVMYVLLH